MKRLLLLSVLNLVLLGYLLVPTSLAQSQQTQLSIVHTSPKVEGDHMALDIFFSLQKPDGTPILKSGDGVRLPGEGLVQLSGNGSSPVSAAIGDPSTPIRIAMVIDASGSMSGRIDQVREAAKKAIEAAPPQAEIAIYTFHNQVEQLSKYENSVSARETLKVTIDSFNPLKSGTGDTCLYDAADKALSDLRGSVADSSIRHAIILFTDGKDREAGGATCKSNYQRDGIITKATEDPSTRIPIYTIGLCKASNDCGNINTADLEEISKQTKAIFAKGDLASMEERFGYIMDVLSSQWVARANVYPSKGSNTFLLSLKLDEQTALSGAGVFSSPQDFAGRPAFSLSPSYVAEEDKFAIALNTSNITNLSQVTIEVWDGENSGTRIDWSVTLDKLSPITQFDFPTNRLEANKEYWFRVTAKDRNGQAIRTDLQSEVLHTHKFVFQPELGYSIENISPNWQSNMVDIDLKVYGKTSSTLLFSGKIEDSNTREVVATISPMAMQNAKLQIPMPNAWQEGEARTYLITLTLDDNGREIIQSSQRIITPPPPPSLMARIGSALLHPIALGIYALALIAIAIVAFRSRRNNKYNHIPDPSPYNSGTSRLDDRTIVAMPNSGDVYPNYPASPNAAKQQVRIRISKTPDRTQANDLPMKVPGTIGRAKADLIITGDSALSRPHLRIDYQNNTLSVTDLGSSNGTFINGQRLTPHQAVPINEQSQIRLGPNTILTCTLLP